MSSEATGEDSLLDKYGMFVRGASRLPREKYDLSSLLRCASTWWIAPSPSTTSDRLVLEYENRSMQERLAEEIAHSDNWETLNSCASICFGRELTISLELVPNHAALPFHTAVELSNSIECLCGKTIGTGPDGTMIIAALTTHYREDACGYALEDMKAEIVKELDEIEMSIFITREDEDDT